MNKNFNREDILRRLRALVILFTIILIYNNFLVSHNHQKEEQIQSYTLGKAATTMMNAGKQNVKSENPNAERYAKAQRDAMNHRNLSSTRKNGRETVRFKNGGNGYIEIESNGAQYLVDYGHHRIGSYDPIRNETYDGNGRKVGKGNLLKTLLS